MKNGQKMGKKMGKKLGKVCPELEQKFRVFGKSFLSLSFTFIKILSHFILKTNEIFYFAQISHLPTCKQSEKLTHLYVNTDLAILQ
jgi:hypothetical protein